MIERHVKTVHYLRDTLTSLKKEEGRRLDALKETKLYQAYETWKADRLDAANKTKAAEDELRQALIDDQLIDGDARHPAVKSVTRKTAYEYTGNKARKYALDNNRIELLSLDPKKFDNYLDYLVEINEPLPDFVEEVETVSVALVSDLSEVVK